MSGTDAAGTAAIVTNLDVETRKAITAARKLFLNPGEVHLFTMPDDERWLSDRYVMIMVTGHPYLFVPEDSEVWPADGSNEWPDGLYKLTAGKGLQPAKPGLVCPDTAALLTRIENSDSQWHELYRTEWSMADDEARKMLVYANLPPCPPMQGDYHAEPLAINEGIWTLLEDRWRDFEGEACPDLRFEYAPGRPYRVTVSGHPVAYVATADFPKNMRPMALRLLGVTDA